MKKVGAVIILLLLFSGGVSAYHNSGKSDYHQVDVASDGFDEGYYLVAWANSSGVYGILYWVRNNSPHQNLSISSRDSTLIAIESTSGFDIQSYEDNRYLVVWKGDGSTYSDALHWSLLAYNGQSLGTSYLHPNTYYKVGNYLDVAYGMGYFVIITGKSSTSSRNELRYVVVNGTDGNLVEEGLLFDGSSVYPSSGAIAYASITYHPELGRFGVVFRVTNKTESNSYEYGVYFIDFKLLSNGSLDSNSMRNLSISEPTSAVFWTAITFVPGGYLVSYTKGGSTTSTKWYVVGVWSTDSGLSIGTLYGPYPGYNLAGNGEMAFVDNGTDDYVLLVLQEKETSSSNYSVRVRWLYPDGSLKKGPETLISADPNGKISPRVAIKPPRSPESYIIAWVDDAQYFVQNSEYFSDLSEVSPTNEVPFFDKMLVVLLALGVFIAVFRKS